MNEDVQKFPVDNIADKSVIQNCGAEIFRIHWVGYDDNEDTWAIEEDALPDCYYLIKEYEQFRFKTEREKNQTPEVIRFRKVHNKFKVLVKWPKTNIQEFFYTSVIKSIDPHLLVNIYEQLVPHIPIPDREWTHFLNTNGNRLQIFDVDVPQRIIRVVRCGEEKVCLVQWKHNQEATIVEYDRIKLNHPRLLIKFYERYLTVE